MKKAFSPPAYYELMGVNVSVVSTTGRILKEDDPMITKLLMDACAWSWKVGRTMRLTDTLYAQRIR